MLLSWCKEIQGTKLKLNANSGRIIHSVSHNFVKNEETERDILQYILQIKSFAANLTVEIMLGILTPPKFRPREMWRKHFVVCKAVRNSSELGGLPCRNRRLVGRRYARLRYSKPILTKWQFAWGRQSTPSINENHWCTLTH